MRPLLRTFSLVSMLILAFLPTVTPALAQESGSSDLEIRLKRIADETAQARGFAPLPEIKEVFITADELKAKLPAMIAEDYPPAEAAAESRSYAALGLIPAGTDLGALYTELLGDQVAGYYDPKTKEMYVIGDDASFGATEEFTYSHETVHALQDAYLGLGDRMDASVDLSDDAAEALTSLYEGDAMAGSLAYLANHPQLAFGIAGGSMPDSGSLDRVPAALAIWLLFPYIDGETFVESLRAEGGWDAVNAAFANPPTSTEQILHPEKYLEREDPVAVALPEASTLGSGWTKVDDDTLGELSTAILLANLQPGQGFNPLTGSIDLPEAATNAAAGWGGDRYALWSDGSRDVLVWRSVWDSESDALAFSRALRAYEEGRWGGTFATATANDLTLATDPVTARLVQQGSDVFYVQAPTADLADAALAAIRPGM